MPGRHGQVLARRARPHRAAAAIGLVSIAAGVGAAVLAASPADAKTNPTPSYHNGNDKVTFTVTGVLDGNCLVSTGGNQVYIKPGDGITFASSLVGVSVSDAVAGQTLGGTVGGVLGGTVNKVLQPGQVAGLNVSAVIDPGTSHARSFTVSGGNMVQLPAGALSTGRHTLAWSATSLALLPGLNKSSVPLSSDALKSGAKLSWTGDINVTNAAPQCKLAVSTPKTDISGGPIHVGLPQQNISVPVNEPTGLPSSLGNVLPHGKKSSSTAPKKTATPTRSTSTAGDYVPPVGTVPDYVVPHGSGGGAAAPTGSYSPPEGVTLVPANGGTTSSTAPAAAAATSSAARQDSSGQDRTIDLASSDETKPGFSSQLPVVLAIIAVLGLAMVAGMYARIYLLGRKHK